MNRGPSTLIAHIPYAALQKQWSSSEFLYYYVHNYFKQMISSSNFVLISKLAAVAVLIKFCFEPSVIPQ